MEQIMHKYNYIQTMSKNVRGMGGGIGNETRQTRYHQKKNVFGAENAYCDIVDAADLMAIDFQALRAIRSACEKLMPLAVTHRYTSLSFAFLCSVLYTRAVPARSLTQNFGPVQRVRTQDERNQFVSHDDVSHTLATPSENSARFLDLSKSKLETCY